jgi:hypothetical protein
LLSLQYSSLAHGSVGLWQQHPRQNQSKITSEIEDKPEETKVENVPQSPEPPVAEEKVAKKKK